MNAAPLRSPQPSPLTGDAIMKLTQAANASTADVALSPQAQSAAANAAAPIAQAVAQMQARIHNRVGAVEAQLSNFGKWKATVADIQTSARSLRDITIKSPAADVKTAAIQLATRLNAALGASKLAGTASGTAQTGEALRSAISSGSNTLSALKTLGFKQLQDGTLAFNAATFEARQKSTPQATLAALSSMGQALEAAATAELAHGTDTGGPIATLAQQASSLKANKFMTLAMGVKFAVDHQAPSTGQVSEGLAAYKAKG
jgi:hypothetical protein